MPTKRLPPDLPALIAHFIPRALMHLHRAVPELARERNDLRNNQLRDATRVAERRVEHGDSIVRSILEVDLVRADAEAADDNEVFGFSENARRELRFGTDADDMDVSASTDRLAQFTI